MDSERLENVEEAEEPEYKEEHPGAVDDDNARDECECRENSADFVNYDPAGVFGAGVLHGFVDEWQGCEKDEDCCNKEGNAYEDGKVVATDGDGFVFSQERVGE